MSFQDAFALADDVVFQSRVCIAATKTAVAIMSEAPTTPGHQERGAYAVKVLASPEVEAMNISMAVVTNAAITADSNDGDIEFTVSSIWNAMAGVGLTP